MSLVKNSSIYIFGEILAKLLPFLLLPYLTRKLGVDGFGELANAQAYIVLLVVFIGLSQDGAVARYFYFYGKRSIGLIVSCGLVLSLLFALPLIVFSLYTHNLIVLYIALAALSQVILKVQLSLRQCQKKAFEYTCIQVFSGVFTVAITIFLFETLKATYANRVLAIVIANFLTFFLGLYFYAQTTKLKLNFCWRIRRKGFTYIFMFGFPLVFHQLSFFMKGQLDRILIHENFTPAELGMYAAGFQLASILSILIMAINKAIVPFIYEGFKKKEINFLNVISWFHLSFLFIGLPALFAFLIPESVYQMILGDEFVGSKFYTVLFLLGLGLNIPYLLLVNFLFYHGENKKIAFSTICSSVIHVFFVYLFLQIGLDWIPVSLFLSNIILIIILYFSCKKVYLSQLTRT
nr:oligosaccharide flippase family protein [uncultured Glaciecola sp.]